MSMLTGFFSMTAFWIAAADVQYVSYGSNVTLNCNISYQYDTVWLKQNPDHTPTVVLHASLYKRPIQEFQLDPRFSVNVMNRSFGLRITGIEETDLGLYYCVAYINTHITIGSGTKLQELYLGSSWFHPHHCYFLVIGLGLLIMALAVCITHWKTKSNKESTDEKPLATTLIKKKTVPKMRQR